MSINMDYSRWMETHFSEIGDRSLSQIVIPGSHDTGMYKSENCSLGGSKCNTQTQNKTVLEQLQCGIRYFDLRPVLKDNHFHTGHFTDTAIGYLGCYGGSMSEILNDVAQFMKGSRELVILKFSHYIDIDHNNSYFSHETMTQLVNEVKDTLKGLLFENQTGKRSAKIPLKDIIAEKGAVIAVFEGLNQSQKPPRGIYSYADFNPETQTLEGDLVVYDKFSNVNSFESMSGVQIEKMAVSYNHNGDLFLLSWTMTQSIGDAIESVVIEKDCILEMAAMANHKLITTLKELYAQGKITNQTIPNILYVDDCDTLVTEAAVWLNGQLQF